MPPGVREALHGVAPGHIIATIELLSVREEDQIFLTNGSWEDLEFEVALDSGSVVHVCASADCLGYGLQESPGSRSGQQFLMVGGGDIPNLVILSDPGFDGDVQMIFQIAAVTRPFVSVSKICDEGHEIFFNQVMAFVRNKDGDELCRFSRFHGGLYMAKFKFRRLAGLGAKSKLGDPGSASHKTTSRLYADHEWSQYCGCDG